MNGGWCFRVAVRTKGGRWKHPIIVAVDREQAILRASTMYEVTAESIDPDAVLTLHCATVHKDHWVVARRRYIA